MDKHTMEELQKRFGTYSIQTSWALFYFPRAFYTRGIKHFDAVVFIWIQLFAN